MEACDLDASHTLQSRSDWEVKEDCGGQSRCVAPPGPLRLSRGFTCCHASGSFAHVKTMAHVHRVRTPGDPPLRHVAGRLEEAGVVVLLQALLGLRDQGAGAFQTLAAVSDLLRQFTQLHHLGKKKKKRNRAHQKKKKQNLNICLRKQLHRLQRC